MTEQEYRKAQVITTAIVSKIPVVGPLLASVPGVEAVLEKAFPSVFKSGYKVFSEAANLVNSANKKANENNPYYYIVFKDSNFTIPVTDGPNYLSTNFDMYKAAVDRGQIYYGVAVQPYNGTWTIFPNELKRILVLWGIDSSGDLSLDAASILNYGSDDSVLKDDNLFLYVLGFLAIFLLLK